MKYGLIVFKNSENIGDDIQSYAAKRFLPRVDYYIEREAMDLFTTEELAQTACIMSGWYLHDKFSFPPSPFLYPKIISIHFTDQLQGKLPLYLQGKGLEYLKKYEPVGLRDDILLDLLKKEGINCYFSGCLTLTIKPFPNIKKKKRIVLTDVKPEIKDKIINELKEYEIIENSAIDSLKEKDYETRMHDVEERLKLYQSAELVITKRLHVALPCLALGTKVLLLYEEQEKDIYNRLHNYLDFLHYMSNKDFLNKKDSNWLTHFPENKNNHFICAKKLEKEVKEFINQTKEKRELSAQEKENLRIYRDVYVETEKSKRKIIDEELKSELNKWKKLYVELEQAYIELQKNYENSSAEKEMLSKKINHIYQSRWYRYYQRYCKLRKKDKDETNYF